MNMPTIAISSVLFGVLLIGAGCANRTETSAPKKDDIIYGTSWTDDELQQWKQECTAQGGTLNECGSACADPGAICVQVCAARCEFK